jgi:hypothetical protein
VIVVHASRCLGIRVFRRQEPGDVLLIPARAYVQFAPALHLLPAATAILEGDADAKG